MWKSTYATPEEAAKMANEIERLERENAALLDLVKHLKEENRRLRRFRRDRRSDTE